MRGPDEQIAAIWDWRGQALAELRSIRIAAWSCFWLLFAVTSVVLLTIAIHG
jgi:hypothetical protein